MLEPVYDEDVVNLGYLKKTISDTEDGIKEEYENVSRHYASQPIPPYYKGDTWIDGSIVYTCINTRTIGLYTASDWVTESGAKAEAERKNKTYTIQPSNYSVGDMWILQSDNDHKSGKKGEMLISTVGRSTYNENDWINMLSYGNIASINELSNNINEAINLLGITKTSGILQVIYSDEIPSSINADDLWYVTEDVSTYEKGQLYKYDGSSFELINDGDITEIFGEANHSVLTSDGKIQIYYSDKDQVIGMAIGDLCNDSEGLYRYNGTKWIPVYDIKVENVIRDLSTVSERTVSINTDLGEISQIVSETATTTDELTGQIESINEEVSDIRQTQNNWEARFSQIGGNNLFFYGLELWKSYSGIEEYSDTDIMSNSVSGKGYKIGSGTSKQDIEVKNGTYTISFRYKKIGPDLADIVVRINGEEYSLEETEWTDFVQTIDITTNHIEFEIESDTNESMLIADLLATVGNAQEIWTQNPNEIRTDTVSIGKGIKVESTEKNTFTKIDADGNRTFNKATGERVAEMTDKGVYTKELECSGKSQISGLLVQQVGDQTWFSSLL